MFAGLSVVWILLPLVVNAGVVKLGGRNVQLMARQDCQSCGPELLCCADFTLTLAPFPFSAPIPVVTIPFANYAQETPTASASTTITSAETLGDVTKLDGKRFWLSNNVLATGVPSPTLTTSVTFVQKSIATTFVQSTKLAFVVAVIGLIVLF